TNNCYPFFLEANHYFATEVCSFIVQNFSMSTKRGNCSFLYSQQSMYNREKSVISQYSKIRTICLCHVQFPYSLRCSVEIYTYLLSLFPLPLIFQVRTYI